MCCSGRSNLTEDIDILAKTKPDLCAVMVPRRDLFGRLSYENISFYRLNQDITRVMVNLSAVKVCSGSRVLMMLRPGYEFICVFFSLLRLGAVPIVIDSGLGLRKFFSCAERSKPEFVIGEKIAWVILKFHRLPTVKFILTKSKLWAKSSVSLAGDINGDSDPDAIAAVLFTSGSTGIPKGVIYRHRHFLAQLDILKKLYKFDEEAVDLTLLPVFMLFNPVLGRTTVLPEINPASPAKLDPKKFVQAAITSSATSSFGSPVLWKKIAKYCHMRDLILDQIKFIFLAGVSASSAVIKAIKKVAPNAEIHTPYGATEALPICDIEANEIISVADLENFGAGICVGYPVDGVRVMVIDVIDDVIVAMEDGLVLPTGSIGEIVVSGVAVTEEYDNLSVETSMAKIFDKNTIWHRTGDLGFFDQRGRLWFCGRKSERIEVGDEIYCTECIESLFVQHAAVERVALVKYKNSTAIQPAIAVLPRRGFFPKFFWQRRKFSTELRAIANKYPKTRAIKKFFFHRAFPVDVRHNSKINRGALSKNI
ncbi:MAG: AMP-binding protein [Puniceicoccales bacterium]|jgi:acyl-CoA synthetase (AMP-forming)/AMP-acid ligase II|nr:AMP-binding protein [Puniceicoccales bacterium]